MQDAENVRLPWGHLGFREVHDICGTDIEIYDTVTGEAIDFSGNFRMFVGAYNTLLHQARRD